MGNTVAGHYKRKSSKDDAPLKIDLVQSVLEMRLVYSNLTPREFASYYSSKYRGSGLKPVDVLDILDKHEQK
ncbi:MAG: hypothetical protein ABS894_00930 [Aerococcus urinaeequi]